jgi:cytochrome b561
MLLEKGEKLMLNKITRITRIYTFYFSFIYLLLYWGIPLTGHVMSSLDAASMALFMAAGFCYLSGSSKGFKEVPSL